ncbi:mucin-5AC-like [Chenopodium quinoa]|uniref:mucin-5AC-like n=1 Tax=Chenopodium quinoa TaxID=63459 RepID=UPI000B77BEEF|nr:mucin-5AC-like [Chenopodium quinoa]
MGDPPHPRPSGAGMEGGLAGDGAGMGIKCVPAMGDGAASWQWVWDDFGAGMNIQVGDGAGMDPILYPVGRLTTTTAAATATVATAITTTTTTITTIATAATTAGTTAAPVTTPAPALATTTTNEESVVYYYRL